MVLDDLWKIWLLNRQQQTPEGYEQIRQYNNQNIPRAYWLQPENMAAVLNAYSPYDLFMKPDYTTAMDLGYPTPAFNINNKFGVGIPSLIALASQLPQNKLSQITNFDTIRKNYNDIPQALQKYIPQGVYEHEVGHYLDPRLVPSANNYGYISRMGLPGGIASREEPAMQKENRFWEYILNRGY